MKAYIPSDPSPDENGTSSQRLALQGAPHYGLEVMNSGTETPFANYDHESKRNQSLISRQQAGFVATSPSAIKPLFHDITAQNQVLLTNVRAGGFRHDSGGGLDAEGFTAQWSRVRMLSDE